METYNTLDSIGYRSEPASGEQYAPNQYFSVPTQNSFAPLHEWVGYSMGVEEPEPEQMDIQWVPVRNKRRRFNTASPNAGTGQINFPSLNMDEKLSQMFEKLNSLEQSNKEIMKFGQQINLVQSKVDMVEQRTVNHETFLKVLAYKSIDIEARSRRCNLVFHGLKESKNENLEGKLQDFMWNEMGIDSDDFIMDRFHRLGSFHKAKQRQMTGTPTRPVIVAFQEYRYIGRILDAAYMLKGSGFSVTKDYPKEMVAARQRLLPLFKAERQNRSNKVSLENPARLVVNGRVIKDEFPDWYQVLEYDRYKLACGDYSLPMDRPRENQIVQPPVNRLSFNDAQSGIGGLHVKAQSSVRSYPHSPPAVPQQPNIRFQGDSLRNVTSVNTHPYTTPGFVQQQSNVRPPEASGGAVGATAPNQVMTYANVTSSVVQNQSFVRPPSSTAIQGPQISTALPGSYAPMAPRYMPQNTGNQNRNHEAFTTTTTTANTTSASRSTLSTTGFNTTVGD